MGRYNELMDRVVVTQEMRTRLLAQAQPLPERRRNSGHMRTWMAAAACLALAAGLFLAKPASQVRPPAPNPPGLVTGVAPRIVRAADLEELSDFVDFSVCPPDLPFRAETVEYLACTGPLAEIRYTAGEQTACFRQSLGEEDNSGDWTDYPQVLYRDGMTLKGADGVYRLALWCGDGYSFSLSLSSGLGAEAWDTLLK